MVLLFLLRRRSPLEPVAHQRRPGLGLLLEVDGLVEIVVLIADVADVARYRMPRELRRGFRNIALYSYCMCYVLSAAKKQFYELLIDYIGGPSDCET